MKVTIEEHRGLLRLRFNGRAAMVGFAALLIIEYVTGHNPLAALGFVIN